MRKFLIALVVYILISLAVSGLRPDTLPANSTLSRTFDGVDDFLESAANVDLTGTQVLNIAFWLWQDDDTDTQVILEHTAEGTATDGGFLFYLQGGNIFANFKDGGTHISHISQASQDAWHHYLFKLDNTVTDGVTLAWVDAVSVMVTEDDDGADGDTEFASDILNVMARDGGAAFHTAGRIAGIAIWKSGALDGDDATFLYGCGDPDTLSPDYFWKILQVSPETPEAGGVNLTVSGTSNSDGPCVAGAPAGNQQMLLLGVGN